MEIDRGLLLTLDVLLRERNATRAAGRLGLGQSSLSARLVRLREIFADPLFVPASTGRGVVPTARAMELQGDLSDLLERMDRFFRTGPPIPARRVLSVSPIKASARFSAFAAETELSSAICL